MDRRGGGDRRLRRVEDPSRRPKERVGSHQRRRDALAGCRGPARTVQLQLRAARRAAGGGGERERRARLGFDVDRRLRIAADGRLERRGAGRERLPDPDHRPSHTHHQLARLRRPSPVPHAHSHQRLPRRSRHLRRPDRRHPAAALRPLLHLPPVGARAARLVPRLPADDPPRAHHVPHGLHLAHGRTRLPGWLAAWRNGSAL